MFKPPPENVFEKMLDAVCPLPDTWSDLESEYADRQRDKAAVDLLAALTAAERTGWKLVPVEPSDEMTLAASKVDRVGPMRDQAILLWDAMLGAVK